MRQWSRLFTLVELVMALGILSILAVMVLGILVSVQRLHDDIAVHTVRQETLRNLDRIADYALKNIIPFQWLDEDNREREIFYGTSDAVVFAYLHRITNAEEGGIRFLELKLDGRKLTARYRKTPILYWLGEPRNDGTAHCEILADGIEEFRLEYADREGEDIIWHREWDEDKNSRIPLAIFLYLRFSDGTEEQWLRRTAGSGFNSSLGRRNIKK